MNLSFFIARRYLGAKKSNNVINYITGVSIIAISVVTTALLMVLSIFNGLSGFIEELYSALDPDVKVEAVMGRTFEVDSIQMEQLASISGVAALSRSIEGKVALRYYDKQHIAIIKGVDDQFIEHNPIQSVEYTYDGEFTFERRGGYAQGVFGSAVAAFLGANLFDQETPIKIYVPVEDAPEILGNPLTAIKEKYIFPAGYFSVQKEYDEKYVLADIGFVRDLFEYENEITSLEFGLKPNASVDRVKSGIRKVLGEEVTIKTWREQHDTLYRVMKNEKFISYLILALMLVIAAVNILGSLSMIVLEKTRDIATLRALGASSGFIRRIFVMEGLLVGGIGVMMGMFEAFIFGIMQTEAGVLRLYGGESFRVLYFPLEMQIGDFLLIFFTVIVLSVLASLFPAARAANVNVVQGLRK